MDLWIRSQNKKQLELVKHIEINHKQEFDNSVYGLMNGTVDIEECYILVNGRNFGEYKTEQRAIEVLNEIQNTITNTSRIIVETYADSIKDSDSDKIKEIVKENLEDVTVANRLRIKALNIETVVYEMPADDTPPCQKNN